MVPEPPPQRVPFVPFDGSSLCQELDMASSDGEQEEVGETEPKRRTRGERGWGLGVRDGILGVRDGIWRGQG